MEADEPEQESTFSIFWTYLKLGLTSFGGPIAHLGYFHRELVEKRRWVSESEYAQLLGLTQFLPGPSSSQLGFSLGLVHGGWLGGIAAFLAFTLPSALLLFGFASLVPHLSGTVGSAAVHGLKIVALVVVAQGILVMGKKLCPDLPRLLIAAVGATMILLSGSAWTQLLVVALGGVAGLIVCPAIKPTAGEGLSLRYGARQGWILLTIFLALLLLLPVLSQSGEGLIAAAEAFYRAGALVFGGGHVVLPLLEETVVEPGWVSKGEFLAGYGAAQAVPGPMFSFSAYLGARLPGDAGGALGASVCLLAIFLPGFLLVSGILPLWKRLADRLLAARAIAGVNAAVVGLLAAALYDPIWISAVRGPLDLVIALIGWFLLARLGLSAIYIVLWCVMASVGLVFWT